VTFWTIPVVWG